MAWGRKLTYCYVYYAYYTLIQRTCILTLFYDDALRLFITAYQLRQLMSFDTLLAGCV